MNTGMNMEMNVLSKIKNILKKPSRVVLYVLAKPWINRFIPDKTFLKLEYRFVMGKKLNLKNPRTYNEKLQWLKLYNRKDEYTMMADKYAVREYVEKNIGEEYLIPLIGVWDSVEEIDFDALPHQFALKCNHTSGDGVIICKDKSALDIEKTKKDLKKAMKTDFSLQNREWPYKNIKRKIIAEKYMVDESGTQLKDYKFFCFNGEVKAMFVATDRGVDTRFDFYDSEFNHLDILNGHENAVKPISKPEGFDEMLTLAEKLSAGLPHIRVDFYDINGKVYFGEVTFYHWSGFTPFEPEDWDYTFGSWIELPEKE